MIRSRPGFSTPSRTLSLQALVGNPHIPQYAARNAIVASEREREVLGTYVPLVRGGGFFLGPGQRLLGAFGEPLERIHASASSSA